MKKLITLIAVLTLAAHAHDNDEPIANASYAIYSGKPPHPLVSKETACRVTFYTFDGNPIITVNHPEQFHFGYPKVAGRLRLDPSAPKPQPVTYEIQYASRFPTLAGSSKCIIYFYDKNGNLIEQYTCDTEGGFLVIYYCLGTTPYIKNIDQLRGLTHFPLDLSRVSEKFKPSKKLRK